MKLYFNHPLPRAAALATASFLGAFAITACVDTGPQPITPEMQREEARLMVAECIASNCTTLVLDHVLLDDLSALAAMPNLRVLMMNNYSYDSLETLPDLPQLRELHISHSSIADLTPLSRVPNLQVLHVQGNENIASYAPIAQLTGLEELAIGHWEWNDLSIVRSLPNLKRLLVDTAENASLAPLRRHPSLESIDFESNFTPDAATLLTIPNLARVSTEDYGSYGDTPNEFDEAVRRLREGGVEVDVAAAIIVC